MRPQIIISRYRFRFRHWASHMWYHLTAGFRGVKVCPFCFKRLGE